MMEARVLFEAKKIKVLKQNNKTVVEFFDSMTVGGLLEMLEACAKKNRLEILKSIERNKNNYEVEAKDLEQVSQPVIDAVLCDFINAVSRWQGRFGDLSPKYLKQENNQEGCNEKD